MRTSARSPAAYGCGARATSRPALLQFPEHDGEVLDLPRAIQVAGPAPPLGSCPGGPARSPRPSSRDGRGRRAGPAAGPAHPAPTRPTCEESKVGEEGGGRARPTVPFSPRGTLRTDRVSGRWWTCRLFVPSPTRSGTSSGGSGAPGATPWPWRPRSSARSTASRPRR